MTSTIIFPMGMRRKLMAITIGSLVIHLLILLTFPISAALAKATTAEQARLVVINWLHMDNKPMEAMLGQEISVVETYSNNSGNALYYVVYLEPTGFVIVPADNLVEPIIGFLPEGRYDPSTDNPLGALVSRDVPGRVMKAREIEKEAQSKRLKFPGPGLFEEAQHKWDLLTDSTRPTAQDFNIASVSDIRVSPLVQSKWSQSTECESYCYNYYTPNHYVCGCVATAQAQLMRYHTYPTTGPGTPSFTVYVDGIAQSRSLRGGDGSGGAYDWSSMVLDPDCSTTEAQCQTIGTLTHDVGVSVNMQYASAASGAYMDKTADSLVYTFGYSNAKKGYNSGSDLPDTSRNKMVNPNLDAGFPVLLGVRRISSGHAIVCDGYGYNVSTLYHHLNMGWAGASNAWYNLPNIDSSPYAYTSVSDCIYNVFTSGSGEIISGRVVDSGGNPLNGVTVTAIRTGGGTYTGITDNNGIYSVPKIPSSSTYTITVSKTGYTFSSQIVSTGISINYSTTTGNVWGIDFTASQDVGSISVSIVPQQAADIGAQWRVAGEAIWRNSGSTKSNVQFGTYTIEFKDISGWTTPPNKMVTLFAANPDPWINSDPYIAITQTYTITATSGSNGSISPSGTFQKTPGDSQVFTATPNTNYQVDKWDLDGSTVQTGGTAYTLSNIQSNHSVHVTFKSGSQPDAVLLPDTGQTKCYDNTQEIQCPNPGEPFYGQDANYLTNPPSYTKLDANGNDLSDTATSWVMVRDNVTGLIWEVKTDDGSIHDKDNSYTWYDSNPVTNGGDAGTPGDGTDTEDFITAVNAESFGDYTDWRLPTIKELDSIVNLGTRLPSTDTVYFPNTDLTYYWSSSTSAEYSGSAWNIRFFDGTGYRTQKSNAYPVRAVRGSQVGPLDYFVINGNGTVTDISTGLMWQQVGAENEMSWEEAISYCEGLVVAGYTDWRLPNRKELYSIVDHKAYDPAINTSCFPDTMSSAYWSSSTFAPPQAVYAWGIEFYSGYITWPRKTNPYYYVRAVRAGHVRPTVTTAAISEITANSAKGGGNVSSEGSASVTARGVCWSTSLNPTTSNSKTTNGTGTGSFTSSISGLGAGTTYHVRGYAINSAGTVYGSDVTFTTSPPTLYVSSDGQCGDSTPCYSTIQTAINAAINGTVIKVAQGTYTESISLSAAKTVTLQGGWDKTSFTVQTANKTFIKAPKAPNGKLILQMLTIKP